MRTTVTLDRDVEALVRRRMREHGVSFKVAINEAIRAALARGAARAKPYKLRTYSMGYRPEIALDNALALADAIEDEEVVRKLAQRK